jgi:hypothetical protein
MADLSVCQICGRTLHEAARHGAAGMVCETCEPPAEVRERAIELIEFLALLNPESRADYLGWAARLHKPTEPFQSFELEILRHSCHDRLTELAAAVVQDEPLPRAREP